MPLPINWSKSREPSSAFTASALSRIGLAVLLLLFTGAGCIRISTGGSQAEIYESVDGGKSWTAADTVLTANGKSAVLPLSKLAAFQLDPTDPRTLYLTTQDGGIYQTTNRAASWNVVQPQGGEPLFAMDVDPQHPCTLYGTRPTRIEKSIDCGRRWTTLIQLPESVAIVSIRVNPQNPAMVMAGTTHGDVYLSTNAGNQWVSPLRISDAVGDILFSSGVAQDVYVVGYNSTLYRSSDAGKNWIDISTPLRTATGGTRLNGVFLNAKNPNELSMAGTRVLVHSMDRGNSWTALPLLTTPDVTAIRSLSVDPQDPRILYYANSTTLYRSADMGASWQSFPLPGTALAGQLLIDPTVHGHLFLAITQ